MPGCSGGPVVTNARVYYTTRAAAGASAPGIPHALLKFGAKASCKTRAHLAARRRTRISPSLRGAQRRSNPAFCFSAPKLDCFASLAMTMSKPLWLFENGIQPKRRPGERRDPYAVSRVLRDAVRRLSRNNTDLWLGPGVRRDDERARLAPLHLPNIQNRIRKTLRIILRRIVSDTLEHAPLILRTEMLPVLFGILHWVHPVDSAVNIDRRHGNLWLLSQSCLDARITRIARRVLPPRPIALHDDFDKPVVAKRA